MGTRSPLRTQLTYQQGRGSEAARNDPFALHLADRPDLRDMYLAAKRSFATGLPVAVTDQVRF